MGRETQGGPAGEQKLERYGVWVKVEPRTVVESQGADNSFELTDLEASGASAAPSRGSSLESTLTAEEEKLLDELDSELGPSAPGKTPSIPEEETLVAEEEELPDISAAAEETSSLAELEPVSDEELPELEIDEEPATVPSPAKGRRGAPASESNEVEVTLSETGAGQERFEDLDALETELASVTASSGKTPAASPEILARIEDELRSIRADLTQLRNELSGMRKSKAEPAVAQPPSGGENQSGFFDEDEDETIALTGDELDNILNTAEITEEAAEAAPVEELDEATEAPAAAPVDLPELSESESTAASGIEELPAELELEELATPESAPTPVSASADELPELDLEGIPEIEAAETPQNEAGASEQTADLESIDLEEEPAELETVSEAPGLELLETETPEPSKAASAEGAPADVDLEALAAEAEELESDEPAGPVQDLEIGELEAVSDEAESSSGEPKEIEIAFESEPSAKLETADLDLEPAPAAPASKPAAREGASAIPDDLKDEIRTVLRYMDHLLEALPDEKIQEFAKSDYFVMYKKLFEDLGLGE